MQRYHPPVSVAPTSNSKLTSLTASPQSYSTEPISKLKMMIGTSTGAKNNSSPNPLIRFASSPTSGLTTSATSTKSAEKIYSPKMWRNLRERSRRKAKAKKQPPIITCPSLTICLASTRFSLSNLRKQVRIKVFGLWSPSERAKARGYFCFKN